MKIDNFGNLKRISVVIPTLNENGNIKHVFPNIPEYVDEIIVIDGNSTDGTREEILKHKPNTKIFNVTPTGKGDALRMGFEKSTGDIIIMMDADGSHRFSEFPTLLEPVLNGHDVSKGSRFLPNGGSEDFTAFRRMGNQIFVGMVNVMYGAKITDICYGYCAFKRHAIAAMDCKSSGFEIETEQSIRMIKTGLKIKEFPSVEQKRISGESNLNAITDGTRILKTIIKEYFVK